MENLKFWLEIPAYGKVFLLVLQFIPSVDSEASPAIVEVVLGLEECFYPCSIVRVLHCVAVPQGEQTVLVTTAFFLLVGWSCPY